MKYGRIVEKVVSSPPSDPLHGASEEIEVR